MGRLARHDDGVGGVVLREEGVVSGKEKIFEWLVERGSVWVDGRVSGGVAAA